MIESAGQWIRNYPYLFANLPLLALALALPRLLGGRDYRRACVFSGVAFLPCSLLASIDQGSYWDPVRLGGLGWGIEDVNFTLWAGVFLWIAATYRHRSRMTIPDVPARAARLRMLRWGAPTVAAVLALCLGGADWMTATLAGAAGLLLYLLLRRPALWTLSITGMAVFTPFYVLVVKIHFALWPYYITYWNPENLWAPLILGIPRGEIAWAALSAAMWPAVLVSALEMPWPVGRNQDSSGPPSA